MGAASVEAHARHASKIGGPSWKLNPPHKDNAQGLIVSAFPHLPVAAALLLELPPQGGGAWLRTLTEKIPITSAGGLKPSSAALALTSSGLTAMGLDDDTLMTFAPPFVEGMRQIDRQRRLGDGVLDPTTGETVVSTETVIPGGPLWSGNAPERYHVDWEKDAEPTPLTVHAALLLYAEDGKLEDLVLSAETALAQSGVKIVRRIDLSQRKESDGFVHEHFGFADGISQPVPYGPTISPGKRDYWHGVPAGDLLIGHAAAAGDDPTPGPIVKDTLPGADVLPEMTTPYGFRDLGLDGTYIVIRELRQDVKAFWRTMIKAARSRGRDQEDTWLAERVIGRTLGGVPLATEKDEAHQRKTAPSHQNTHSINDFGYFHDDLHGLGCPLGSHMRRANPRDGLAPTKADRDTFRIASNHHRILRRGRKFGPVIDGLAWAKRVAETPDNGEQPADAPDAERGLLFMAINTDITRQFEFVQQTWVLNRCFAALYEETDPLVGPSGPFTVPEKPLRALPEVETYVRLAGGDYFFVPSLAALNYLAQLQ